MKKYLKLIVPSFIYIYLSNLKRELRLYPLKSKIVRYLEDKVNKTDTEKEKILSFLKHNFIYVYPYPYIKKYKPNYRVYTNENNMKYVLHENKRLYFKRGLNDKYICEEYNRLLMEQDAESPHCYLTTDFQPQTGDVIVDIGTAEGNFALSVVEKASKLYLFEIDHGWIEALQATFEPWKDKVVIVNKYVSNKEDETNVSLDTFLKGQQVDLIKADIEGAELQLLDGAESLLSQDKLKIILCTYHRQNDAGEINCILSDNGFKTEFSNGYMIFYYDKLQPPYLRRGVIRGVK